MGCWSASTMGSARTLPRGKVQGFIAPGVVGIGGNGTTNVFPQFEGGIRVGVTDRVELGAKAWLVGFNVDAKIGIVRPASPLNGFNLSVAPGIGLLGGTTNLGYLGSLGASGVNFYLPLLMGFRFAGHELTLAPKVVDTQWVFNNGNSTTAENWLFLGSSLGFSIKLGEFVRLIPEVSFLAHVLRFSGGTTVTGNEVIFQGGIGLAFGGSEEEPIVAPPPPPFASP